MNVIHNPFFGGGINFYVHPPGYSVEISKSGYTSVPK